MHKYKYLVGVLSIVTLGFLIFICSSFSAIATYSKIAASPYESTPEEVALAFAYTLDKEDFDSSTSLYDVFADSTVSIATIDDLKKAVGLPDTCDLATQEVEDVKSRKLDGTISVAIPYICEGKATTHEIYVSNGTWETPNGAGKFVVSIAAGKAGYPL